MNSSTSDEIIYRAGVYNRAETERGVCRQAKGRWTALNNRREVSAHPSWTISLNMLTAYSTIIPTFALIVASITVLGTTAAPIRRHCQVDKTLTEYLKGLDFLYDYFYSHKYTFKVSNVSVESYHIYNIILHACVVYMTLHIHKGVRAPWSFIFFSCHWCTEHSVQHCSGIHWHTCCWLRECHYSTS